VRALQQLRADRAARRERVGQVRLNVAEAERSTAKVVEAKNVSFGYGPETVVRDFSSTIQRGDKVGIIGPNGCGKTTLLNLLVGKLQPTEGTVTHGSRIQAAYFDQLRDQLDPGSTVADAVSEGNEFVTIGEDRRHIYSYLQDFLFSPDTARQPVSSLSGGERSRLLLARLFTQPANVLVLDEPTNDLDTDTLELLEARLVAFQGTALVVSHDRAFLDNLCTSTLVFEGSGTFKEYVGGYTDWKRTVAGRESSANSGGASKKKAAAPQRASSQEEPTKPRKLTFKERQQWTALPGQIEALEHERNELQKRLSDPGFLRGDADEIRAASLRAKEIEDEIEQAFELWGELDERA
jgi:ATP-binding cassette subfamily F protein uup